MGTVRLLPAVPAHEARLLALLRQVAMPGWVRMATTRESRFFEAARHWGREQAFVGLDGDTLAGLFASTAQAVFVNGQPVAVGYLGTLRVAPAYRHRIRLFREGFALIRATRHAPVLPLWYTAIGQGNAAARRLLEAGLRGLPRYHHLNDLVTLALPCRRARAHGLWQPVPAAAYGALADFYNRQAAVHQFAPSLSAARMRRTGARFHAVRNARGDFVACVGIWNRQPHVQTRALGYGAPLGQLLPVYNTWARLARRVPLPPAGAAFDHAYAAFLAVAPEREGDIAALLEDAMTHTPTAALTLGLHARHPWLAALRPLHATCYRTRLYAVAFDDDEAMPPLEARPAQPEVAVM